MADLGSQTTYRCDNPPCGRTAQGYTREPPAGWVFLRWVPGLLSSAPKPTRSILHYCSKRCQEADAAADAADPFFRDRSRKAPEPAPANSDEEDPRSPEVRRLGLDQRLVKSWRLPEEMGARQSHDRSGPRAGVHAYLEPRTGIFYARVPETEEGTLYAATDLRGLRAQVLPALDELEVAEREAAGPRVWEPRIRVRYSGGSEKVGGWPTAEPTTPWRPRHLRGGALAFPTREPAGVVPCVEIGALTFSRYERSPQPGGERYDLRELAEDFQERLARYDACGDLRDDRGFDRPERWRKVEWTRTAERGTSKGHGPPEFRDIPYSGEVWTQLSVFCDRFAELDRRLRGFLLEAETPAFLAVLAGGAPLLTDRS